MRCWARANNCELKVSIHSCPTYSLTEIRRLDSRADHHSLTTLLCILLSAPLTKRLALLFCGTGLCCILAAAAMERLPERKVLLRAEENVLTVYSRVKSDCSFVRSFVRKGMTATRINLVLLCRARQKIVVLAGFRG
jgi:hypothetical protein